MLLKSNFVNDYKGCYRFNGSKSSAFAWFRLGTISAVMLMGRMPQHVLCLPLWKLRRQPIKAVSGKEGTPCYSAGRRDKNVEHKDAPPPPAHSPSDSGHPPNTTSSFRPPSCPPGCPAVRLSSEMNTSKESQMNQLVLEKPALAFFQRMAHWFSVFLTQRRFAIGCGIIAISSLFLLPSFNGEISGDPPLYRGVADDLVNGKLPYRDRVLEYPPYVIPIFVLPRIFGDDSYFLTFMGMAFLADWMIKMVLLVIGLECSATPRGLIPVLCYSLAVPFIHYFYLQRYDVWPALICLAAVWLFSSGRHVLCGLAIAVGIGVKLYPVLLVPPLFVLALRLGKGRRFLAGLAAGLLPIVLLSFVLPWWRFAQFQGARGLQCESLAASLIWSLKDLGLTNASWVYVRWWFEVQGPMASALLPWARALFIIMVLCSVTMASLIESRYRNPGIGRLARLLLLPLLGFVAFNQVLSPQFMIWLLPLAALGSLEGNPLPMLAIPLATVLTPIFFPCPEYISGLNLWETIILLLRNLVLIAAWIMLIVELFPAFLGKAKGVISNRNGTECPENTLWGARFVPNRGSDRR
jgi:hypothetical protein